MKPERPRPQVRADPPLLRRRDIDVLAARSLALFTAMGVFGTMLAVALYQGITLQVRLTMQGMLAVLLLTLLAMYRFTSLQRPRLVVGITLVLGVAILGGLAGVMGVGVHATSIGMLALVIALAGVLVGVRAAVAIAVMGAAVVVLLFALEQYGWIGGRTTAAALPSTNRVYSLLAMLGLGLVTAVVLSRMYLRALDLATAIGARMSALLSVGADWVWEQDTEGRITYITEAFARGAGLPVEAFIGRTWWEVPGLAVPDGGWEPVKKALASGQPLRDQIVRTRDGRGARSVLRFSIVPRHDESGALGGWLGVGRDITAEVQAQEQHEELRQLLEAVFRTNTDAMVLCTLPEGRIVLCNGALNELLGYAENDAIGRTLRELGLWVDETERQRLRDTLAADRRVVDEPVRLRHRDGREIPMTITASRLQHHGAWYMVAAARDQTRVERERAQASIIFENANVGIALIRDARFVRVNRKFAELVEMPVEQMEGASTDITMSDKQAWEALVERSRAGLSRGGFEYEGELTGHDGRRRFIRMRAHPVDSLRPLDSGSIWLMEDVTQALQSRAALTKALAAAETANRAKSAFLAAMSHEIRTPLNGTLGMIRLALATPRDDPRREEFLQHASASADTLAGIIGDVLDLSRIEAGRLQLETEVFDLHELVQTIARAQRPLAEGKGLDWALQIDPRVPLRVRGDALRVRQLIVNYLSNAIKFTERGQVVLRLSAMAGGLRIEVEDQGPGIAPEVQGRLFRPFEQADPSTTRRFGGTGLGLSICRELATLMGGQVGVSSTPGAGSLFWAELPLPAVDQASRVQPDDARSPPPLNGLRVLVVEDNAVNMLIAAELLRRWGAEVLEALDGQQAIGHLQPGHAIDIVLMDLHMPVMNGLQATRRLREQPHNRHLPIIALTAAALTSEQQQALEAGMDSFVAKPVDPPQLLQAIQTARMNDDPRPPGGRPQAPSGATS